MATNTDVKVNGVVLPAPISIDYNYEDLDADSLRDVNSGKLDRNRIRADVLKVTLTYGVDDINSVSQVLQAISPATFSVELLDLKTGARVLKTMYAGAKSMQMVKYKNVWIKSMKFNLVEV